MNETAPPRVRRTVKPLGVLGLAVLVALPVAPIPTHTWQANAAIALIGLAVVVLAASDRPTRPTRADRRSGVTLRSAAPWIGLSVSVLVLELGALLYGSRLEFPTISYLLGPEFVDAGVRFVGYVAWICGGFWLVRR